MTDMAGIAGNAVSVYQQALTTVSNNIANVSTEGYSRQDVSLSALPVTKYGAAFLGSGVGLDRIKRQYDAFVESNLRNTTSDLEAQGPMVNYANRVVDVLGSSTMGLNTAFDAFFASARNLSGDPASTVLRSGFIRDSQGVADRFGQLSSQLDLVQEQTQQDLESSINQINTLTDQIAKVNTQLAKQKIEAGQPPDLLDQRDLLLKQLSVFTRINTRFEVNGIVTVSAGPTINADVLVNNQKSFQIAANFDSASTEKVALVLDPYGNPSSLSRITSGSLSGILAFRAQVLGGSRTALDGLAQTFANEVNKIHEEGVDGYGKAGQAMFTFDPKAANLAGGMQVTFDDPLMVAAGAQFRVVEGEKNPSGTNAKVAYDLSPAASTGNNAATTVAGPPALQTVLLNNASVGIAKQINVSSSMGVTSVAAVNLGLQDVSVYLDNMQPGQQLQIYTRDGRHLMGSSDISALAEDNLVKAENGFAQGATLSDEYLNKSGLSADGTQVLGYKGMNIFYGAQAKVPAEPILDSQDAVTGYNYLPAVLSGNRIATLTKNTMPPPPNGSFPEGSFTLNGHDLGNLTPPGDGTALQSSAVAQWVNQSTALTGVTAKASNVIVIKPQDIRFGMPLYIQGQAVQTKNTDSTAALAKAINQANAGVEAVVNSTGELIITNNVKSNDISINISQLPLNNGLTGLPLFIKDGSTWKEIVTASVTTPEELVAAINNAGAGVQARLSGFDLVISRTASRAGEDISISTEASDAPQTNSTTALGIAPRTFKVAQAGDDISVSATLSDNPGLTSITALGISSTTFHGKVDLIKPAIDAVVISTSKIDLGTDIRGKLNAKGLMINGQPIELGNIRIPKLPDPPLASASALEKQNYQQALNLAMPGFRSAMLAIAKAINDKAGQTQVTARLSDDSQNLILGSIASDTNPKIRISGSIATTTATFAANQIDYNKPLYLSGSGLAGDWKAVDMSGISTLQGLADQINSSDAKVVAIVNADGKLEIRNDAAHLGQNIGISATGVDNDGSTLDTALGLTATTFSNGSPIAGTANSQYTYQSNALGIVNGSWPAEPINTVTIKKDQVNFDKPLFIKDAGVWKKVFMGDVETLEDFATNISNSGAGVIATVNALGDLEIRNDEQHRGQDIRTSAVASDATGTSLVTALGQIATTFRVKYDFKPSGPIQLGFGAGSPNQLAQLGFRTGAFVSGEVKDDLLIFVTGPGNAAVSATYSGQAADAKQNLRGQTLDVKFFQDPAKYKGALYYTISSKDATKPGLGATVVAERVFDPEQLNPGVSFQGLNISFTGVPKVNDVFTLDGNKDGLGNNDNLLSISELETKAVVGSKTLTNSYIDQVNEMGNIARQAAISQTALKVVNEQALKSRDEISGVSLDKEAADLIRYQQAYQASAKVLQIASQLFEAVLRV
jgi:flagellar hook-associated protein FlgK